MRSVRCEGRGPRWMDRSRSFHLGSLPLATLSCRLAGNDKSVSSEIHSCQQLELRLDLVRGFPDLMITVSRVITTGDVVTALFKAEGTQAAGYAGAINQEKHLDIDQAWRFATGSGLITGITAYWCQAQLYRRLAVKRYDEIAIA